MKSLTKKAQTSFKQARAAIGTALILLTLALFFSLASCASTKVASDENSPRLSKSPHSAKAPDWISGKSESYSDELYLTFAGKGGTRGEAELSAVTGIAAIFSQNVKSLTSVSKRMSATTAEGKTAASVNSNFSKDVTNEVDGDDLIGIEIKEYYESADGVFALAVMDKQKTARLYEKMIAANNEEIARLTGIAPIEEGGTLSQTEYYSFETYARFDFAREISLKNERYLARLNILDFNAAERIQSKVVSSKSLQSKVAQIAGQIPIAVKEQGKSDEPSSAESRIKSALKSAFTQAGFKTEDGSSSPEKSARYALIFSVSFEERATDSSVQCYYSLELTLNDGLLNENLLSTSYSGREASVDFPSAENRATRALETKISQDFAARFADLLSKSAGY